MKTTNNNQMGNEVIARKTRMFRGSEYEVELTQSQLEDIKNDVRIAKLNGDSFDYCLEHCGHGYFWPEKVASVWQEMEVNVEVGMGATMNLWSDRRAMTVTKVLTPRKIEVRENNTICKDWYGSSYEITPELIGKPKIFTLRKGGRWVEEGQPKRYGSVTLTLGFRHHFIDPSF